MWTSNQPTRGRAHRRGPPSEWLAWPPAKAPAGLVVPGTRVTLLGKLRAAVVDLDADRILAKQDDQADPSRGRGGVRDRIGDQLASQQDHDLDQDVELSAVQGRLDEPPGRQTAASRRKVVRSPSSVAPFGAIEHAKKRSARGSANFGSTWGWRSPIRSERHAARDLLANVYRPLLERAGLPCHLPCAPTHRRDAAAVRR